MKKKKPYGANLYGLSAVVSETGFRYACRTRKQSNWYEQSKSSDACKTENENRGGKNKKNYGNNFCNTPSYLENKTYCLEKKPDCNSG